MTNLCWLLFSRLQSIRQVKSWMPAYNSKRLNIKNRFTVFLIGNHCSDSEVYVLLQRLLVWTPSWLSRHTKTGDKPKRESCHSGERFLPMRNISSVTNLMRSYVHWAYRRDWLWWSVPTALLCTSSVWRCQHSWVCVISGAVNNSDELSSHSLLASHVPL